MSSRHSPLRVAPFPVRVLRWLHEYLTLFLGLSTLGLGCVIWSILALPLLALPKRHGQRIGKAVAHRGFKLYLAWLTAIGACRFDLRALDSLRHAPPMILAPNHPGMLDALMVISRIENLVCVLKAKIMRNFFMGAGARLMGYVPNDQFIGTVARSIAALRAGQHVLLFPEGTRTVVPPVNPLQSTVLLIAHRAQVPVQTLIIRANAPFLCKGWNWLSPPPIPMHFSISLGPRFEPTPNDRQLLQQLEAAYREALI